MLLLNLHVLLFWQLLIAFVYLQMYKWFKKESLYKRHTKKKEKNVICKVPFLEVIIIIFIYWFS